MNWFAVGLTAILLLSGPTVAAELRIGLSAETTSLYPNWFVTTGNQQIASHVFDNLVAMDASSQIQPGLAESWRALDENTWEFKLRRGVKFHDGTLFTADQVIDSFDYARTIVGNGSPAGAYLRGKTYKKVDEFTVQITTTQPAPLLPNEMTVIYISARPASMDQFATGEGMIGTGPYKFREWVKGARVVLDRNEDYWGSRPEWDRVTFRLIGSGASRVAALLNSEVDLINDVPPTDVKRLQTLRGIRVLSRPGERIMFLSLDSSRDVSPFVFGPGNKPLFPNPLRDWRVRRAISKAVNRDALVERLMDGQAVSAGQIASPGMFGHNPALQPEPFDPDGAKKLLNEAGYPDGFRMTIHGPNDRYVNDQLTVQAVAAMLARIGIRTEVDTMPWSIYSSRYLSGGERNTPAFSATLYGFGTATGETMSQLWMLLHTTNKERALGHANAGGYSNMRLDSSLEEAMRTFDPVKREPMIQDTSAGYMNDVALVPLFWQVNAWAARPGLSYEPRIMNVTHAMGASEAK